MDGEQRVTIPEHVMVREVGGEAVLLDLETEKYFGLDEIGTTVLRRFAEGATVSEAVDTIVAAYDATTETVFADVAELLKNLVERGLVLMTVDKR